MISDLSFFEVVQVNTALIEDGIDLHTLQQISFWDSLIIAAAKVARCHTVLTEDLQHGATIAGVRIENPFLSR